MSRFKKQPFRYGNIIPLAVFCGSIECDLETKRLLPIGLSFNACVVINLDTDELMGSKVFTKDERKALPVITWWRGYQACPVAGPRG
jgi:O-succinylbenzoate synthase